MDNYNNMIGNQYGNIYGGDLHQNQLLHQQQQQQQQQQHQQQQQIGDGMLMQSTGHDMKNLAYGARESIIASNMDQHQPINYQQQQHMHHHQAMEQQQPMPIPPPMHVIQQQHQQHQQHVPMETLHQQPAVVLPTESVIQQHSTQEPSVLEPVVQQMEATPAQPEPAEVKAEGAAAVSDLAEEKKEDVEGTPSEETVDAAAKTEEQAAEGELKNGEEVKAEDVPAVPEIPEPKKPEIDPQQCRVCMSKEDLVDIFQFENVFRINDLIMKICPTVRISERDFLPHLICNGCIGKVKIAYELKTTCENTEKEYRSNLKRSRNKSRTTASDYVLVNAPDFSESEDDEEIQDEEFKISGSEEASEVDSDESFEIDSRKRRSKPRRRSAPTRRRPAQKKSSSSSAPAPSSKRSSSNSTRSRVESAKKFKPDIVYIEANNDTSEEEDSDDVTLKKSVNNNSSKRKPPTNRSTPAASTPKAAVARKAPEPKQVPTCHICNKTFVKRSSLKAHVERHNDPPTVDCDVCHRTFSSKGRMERHSCQAKPKARRPAASTPARAAVELTTAAGNTGRDLFKTVAPVTSTYWSDDFSD